MKALIIFAEQREFKGTKESASTVVEAQVNKKTRNIIRVIGRFNTMDFLIEPGYSYKTIIKEKWK